MQEETPHAATHMARRWLHACGQSGWAAEIPTLTESARAMISRRQFLAASAASASLSPWAAANSFAQSLPPIKLVVGFAAGGAADFVGRQLALHLGEELGQTVVVDNRPGAGGRIAVEAVKNAKPDGLTLLVTPGSILTIYPHVYDKLSYNPLTDLAPIASLCAVPYSVNIGPQVPASVQTLKDFGEWLKAHPKMASYGSPGAGTTVSAQRATRRSPPMEA